MQPQAKKCQQPPEAIRGKEALLPQHLWKSVAKSTPLLQRRPAELRGRTFLLLYSNQFVVLCFRSPKELIQQATYRSAAVCILVCIMQLSVLHSLNLSTLPAFQKLLRYILSQQYVMTTVLKALTLNSHSFYFKATSSMKPSKSH